MTLDPNKQAEILATAIAYIRKEFKKSNESLKLRFEEFQDGISPASSGPQGERGKKGDQGLQGTPGEPGIHGTQGEEAASTHAGVYQFNVGNLVPGGLRIGRGTNDKLISTVNDDLGGTGLSDFTVRVLGYRHYP